MILPEKLLLFWSANQGPSGSMNLDQDISRAGGRKAR